MRRTFKKLKRTEWKIELRRNIVQTLPDMLDIGLMTKKEDNKDIWQQEK